MHKSTTIRLMEDAVRKAAKSLIRDFGEVENLQVSRKGPGDFVSAADHRSEQILIRELSRAREKYGFVVEESGVIPGEDPHHRWIADPLDGTTNFLHGLPHFSISLALEQTNHSGKTDIVAAVICAPALNQIYWAEKGAGAYLNDRRIAVSSRGRLEDALLATYEYSREETATLSACAASMRNLGSAALELAYVASGRLDAFWHRGLKIWDMAAGLLLVREARGMATEIDGGGNMLERDNILASNGLLHEEIRIMLAAAEQHRKSSAA